MDAADEEDYTRKLIAKVVGSPRYLQSIKGKSPYVENQQDDDARTNGFNATRIAARIASVRATHQQLFDDMVPGQPQAWQQWRGNDCVFAAILKVVLGAGAPTDESADRTMATTLAGHLRVATGPVDDPVILRLMERLGWPHARWPTWAEFQTRADQGKTYVISVDTTVSGTHSHVVVATYSDGWTIYDRQGIRLKRAIAAPGFVNNPLDSWEVNETAAVGEVRLALH